MEKYHLFPYSYLFLLWLNEIYSTNSGVNGTPAAPGGKPIRACVGGAKCSIIFLKEKFENKFLFWIELLLHFLTFQNNLSP